MRSRKLHIRAAKLVSAMYLAAKKAKTVSASYALVMKAQAMQDAYVLLFKANPDFNEDRFVRGCEAPQKI